MSNDTPQKKIRLIKYKCRIGRGLRQYKKRKIDKLKRVIVAIQNTLVSEAILIALKKRGMFAEKSLSGEPQKVADLCGTLFADTLVMDVTRFGDGTFNNRAATINAVKKISPKIKICVVFDNVSDGELSVKVANAKETGLIDAFFYQSVPSDYIADVISTM